MSAFANMETAATSVEAAAVEAADAAATNVVGVRNGATMFGRYKSHRAGVRGTADGAKRSWWRGALARRRSGNPSGLYPAVRTVRCSSASERDSAWQYRPPAEPSLRVAGESKHQNPGGEVLPTTGSRPSLVRPEGCNFSAN